MMNFRLAFSLSFALSLMLGFQNCGIGKGNAHVPVTSATSASSSTSGGGGDGYGYDGKPREYLEWGVCNGVVGINRIVEMTSSGPVLSREGCSDRESSIPLDPKLVRTSEKRDGDALIYDEKFLFEYADGIKDRQLARFCEFLRDETKNPKPVDNTVMISLAASLLGIEFPKPLTPPGWPGPYFPREIFIWKKPQRTLADVHMKEINSEVKLTSSGTPASGYDVRYENSSSALATFTLDINDSTGEGLFTLRGLNDYEVGWAGQLLAKFLGTDEHTGLVGGIIADHMGVPKVEQKIYMKCFRAMALK